MVPRRRRWGAPGITGACIATLVQSWSVKMHSLEHVSFTAVSQVGAVRQTDSQTKMHPRVRLLNVFAIALLAHAEETKCLISVTPW